jgi:hypothetical protein
MNDALLSSDFIGELPATIFNLLWVAHSNLLGTEIPDQMINIKGELTI